MDLKFIGRGAAFNTKEGITNAYLVEGEKLLCLDFGTHMFQELTDRGVLKAEKEIYVLVTHTHCDHVGSLGSLGFYCQYARGTKFKFVLPHDDSYRDDIVTLMRIYGNLEGDAFDVIYEEELDGVFESFSSVRYEYTDHDWNLPSYSLIFETPEGSVFFSADTRVADNLVRFIETHDNIADIYMEVTDLKIPGDVHIFLGDLMEAVDPSWYSRIKIMHVRGDSTIEAIKKAGFDLIEKS